MAAALKKLDDVYDYILIDSQGDRGILQQSIILASDTLLSPIIPDVLESREFMRGTVQLLKSLEPPPGIAVPIPNIPPLLGLIYRQDRTAALPVHRAEVTRRGPTPSAHDTFLALVHELLPHLADIRPQWDSPNGTGRAGTTHTEHGGVTNE